MATMLVTGAGSGIGKALVTRGLRRGDRVIACVLNDQEASSFESYDNLKIVNMDVGSTESVAAGFTSCDEWLKGSVLDAVIHCAGICPLSTVEEQSPEMLQNTLNINAVGSARILQQALPRLRGHDGRVALVSSLWGKVAGPLLSAYCASKHAIEAIADSARRETEGQKVHIMVIEPGVVKTQILDNQALFAEDGARKVTGEYEKLYGSLYKNYAGMVIKNSPNGLTTDAAAERIEKGVFASRPKTRLCVGTDSKAITFLARILPDRALDLVFRKML
jgi:NAD(P)-dependent dehydrogenase (short-subunit alcohol dehydrogenase family)